LSYKDIIDRLAKRKIYRPKGRNNMNNPNNTPSGDKTQALLHLSEDKFRILENLRPEGLGLEEIIARDVRGFCAYPQDRVLF
jgi:hypothetical protein